MRIVKCDTPAVQTWCIVWSLSAAGGSVIEPSSMFELYWVYLFIIISTIALVIGVFLAGGGRNQLKTSSRGEVLWEKRFSEQLHRRILYATLILAYIAVILLINDSGIESSSFSSIDNFIATIAKISYMRYAEDYNPEPLTRFLFSYVYLTGAIFGWYSLRSDAENIVYKAIISILPALLLVAILTTKVALLFWLTFYLSARISFKERNSAARVSVLKYIYLGLLLPIFFFLVQLVRYGGDIQQEGVHVIQVLIVSAIGHIFALKEWFEVSAVLGPSSLGHNTFAGIFELLGVLTRGQGLGYENVSVAHSTTNVYSALRNIVEDFGIVVSIVLFGAFGVISTVLMKQRQLIYRSMHFAIIVWIIFSPFTSIYNYNTLIFSTFNLLIICVIFDLAWSLTQSRVYKIMT